MLYTIKIITSALIIAFATEVARYNILFSALLISLPLVSIISFVWIYLDLRDTDILSKMSLDIFWLVLINLPFFLIFSSLLKSQFGFWISLLISSISLIVMYSAFMFIKS